MPALKFFMSSWTSMAFIKKGSALGFTFLMAISCHSPNVAPSIEFTRLPPAGEGSSDILYTIEGRVKGARPGQRIVLFARSGVWWVQPLAAHPFTPIQRDSTWRASTHPGTAYAALLVNPDYRPPSTVTTLSEKGGSVQAVALADGAALEHSVPEKLDFSGYDWLVRRTPGNPAGTLNQYEAANAWVDSQGFLHLRIRKTPAGWTSAEVSLSRSLGYGSYRFVVSDVSHLEPHVVLTISTWDGSRPYQEMDVEISRFGEPSGKNTQYVVQPYYVPANVLRFFSPAGRLTYLFDWAPGRVAFKTVRSSGTHTHEDVVAGHVFTSGVPSPGSETVHINFYIFDDRRVRLQNGAEVTIEKFEYFP